jgi:hypothetical protein
MRIPDFQKLDKCVYKNLIKKRDIDVMFRIYG